MPSPRPLLAALTCLVALGACGPGEADGSLQTEGVGQHREALVVNDVYAKLKELEAQMPMPPLSTQVDVGTMLSNGIFTGTTTTYVIDPISHKPIPVTPLVSIDGLDLIANFYCPAGINSTLVANGQTVSSTSGVITVNLGHTTFVNWSLTVGSNTRTDKFNVTRPYAMGVGAFTLAAVPVSVVYEPPQNLAHTNAAQVGFRTEMTTITTLSSSNTSAYTPRWKDAPSAKLLVSKILNKTAVGSAINTGLSVLHGALGNIETSVTTGTTVNTDSTLGISQVTAQTISTNSHLGPGHGDLLVFYKDARIMWVMDQGEVSLTILDHGPLAMVSVDTMLNDLAAVKAGAPAPVTGLDQATIEALLKLDPQARISSKVGIPSNSTLPTSRFTKDSTLILAGSSFSNAISHTITQTDKVSTSTTTTTVKNYHAGWLSLVGIGVTKNGVETTTVSLGSSRTDAVSSTVSASFQLAAAAGESYTVEVFYDNVFGSFLTRNPPPPIIIFLP